MYHSTQRDQAVYADPNGLSSRGINPQDKGSAI
jgi:hypothetical protein